MTPFETLKQIKDTYGIKAVAERMITFVQEDLLDEGYETVWINKKQSYKNWRLVPKDKMSPEELKKFERLKEELTDKWRDAEKVNIKDFRKSLK